MGLLTKVNWASAIIIWFIVTNTILEPFAKMNKKSIQNTRIDALVTAAIGSQSQIHNYNQY
jgi:hypothetical protein